MPIRLYPALAECMLNGALHRTGDRMHLTEEEQRRILEAPPRGTWAIILVVGLAMLAGWLYFFFGLFVSHGPVN